MSTCSRSTTLNIDLGFAHWSREALRRSRPLAPVARSALRAPRSMVGQRSVNKSSGGFQRRSEVVITERCSSQGLLPELRRFLRRQPLEPFSPLKFPIETTLHDACCSQPLSQAPPDTSLLCR